VESLEEPLTEEEIAELRKFDGMSLEEIEAAGGLPGWFDLERAEALARAAGGSEEDWEVDSDTIGGADLDGIEPPPKR
jgi:hypothetical protein